MITNIAVVPTTPTILADHPGERHTDLAIIRDAMEQVLEPILSAEQVVVLATGDKETLLNPPETSLDGYGLCHPSHNVSGIDFSGPLCTLAKGDVTPSDMAVMVRLLPRDTEVTGISVPATTTKDEAVALASKIIETFNETSVAVVASGDLGAGHGPKPPRPLASEASIVHAHAVAAALNGHPRNLLKLDMELARQAESRSVGVLRVVGALCRSQKLTTALQAAASPLGVGYVVARTEHREVVIPDPVAVVPE